MFIRSLTKNSQFHWHNFCWFMHYNPEFVGENWCCKVNIPFDIICCVSSGFGTKENIVFLKWYNGTSILSKHIDITLFKIFHQLMLFMDKSIDIDIRYNVWINISSKNNHFQWLSIWREKRGWKFHLQNQNM